VEHESGPHSRGRQAIRVWTDHLAEEKASGEALDHRDIGLRIPTDRYRSFTADWARAGHARAPYGVAVILNAMSSLNPGRVIVTPLPARVVTDELVIVVPVAVS